MATPPISIYIRASEVGHLLGWGYEDTRQRAVAAIRAKLNKSDPAAARAKLELEHMQANAHQVISELAPQAEAEIRAKVARNELSTEEALNKRAKLASEALQTNALAAARGDLVAQQAQNKLIKSERAREEQSRMAEGTLTEASVRKLIEAKYERSIAKHHDNTFALVGFVEGVKVCLVGQCDGKMGDDTIVEIKTRHNKLLGLPKYEMLQMVAYAHMYKTRHALHAEFHKSTNIMRMHLEKDIILRWPDLCNDILSEVKAIIVQETHTHTRRHDT